MHIYMNFGQTFAPGLVHNMVQIGNWSSGTPPRPNYYENAV